MLTKSELPIRTKFRDANSKEFTVFDKVEYGHCTWVCLGGEKNLYEARSKSFSDENDVHGVRLYRLETLPQFQWADRDLYIKPHPRWVKVIQTDILNELLTHQNAGVREIVLEVLHLYPALKRSQ